MRPWTQRHVPFGRGLQNGVAVVREVEDGQLGLLHVDRGDCQSPVLYLGVARHCVRYALIRIWRDTACERGRFDLLEYGSNVL